MVTKVSLGGEESHYRFWLIWPVTWAGVILVLTHGLNLFV